MSKHLLVIVSLMLSVLALSGPATASPELARDWGVQAEKLNAAIRDEQTAVGRVAARPAAVSDSLKRDLIRFAATSDQLAVMIDRSDGPKDLRCIFRGMSEEVGVQLDEIDASGGDARRVYAALVRLEKAADDARDISRAAVSVFAGETAETKSGAGSCPARAAAEIASIR